MWLKVPKKCFRSLTSKSTLAGTTLECWSPFHRRLSHQKMFVEHKQLQHTRTHTHDLQERVPLIQHVARHIRDHIQNFALVEDILILFRVHTPCTHHFYLSTIEFCVFVVSDSCDLITSIVVCIRILSLHHLTHKILILNETGNYFGKCWIFLC